MSNTANNIEVEMELHNCCSCGILFYVPAHFLDAKRKNHDDFWCPNGHKLHYRGGKTEDQIRKENETLKRENMTFRHNLEQMEAKLSGTKPVLPPAPENVLVNDSTGVAVKKMAPK